MRWFGWFQPAPREPRHVRLHLLHEASSSGDFTVEGFQTSERHGWIVLDRAVLLEPDGSRRHVQGPIDIPAARLLFRENLVAVALPELPEFVGAQ